MIGVQAIRTNENVTTARAIAGAALPGNTIRWGLKDNGPLNLDPDDGEMRDLVGAALADGGGICTTLIGADPLLGDGVPSGLHGQAGAPAAWAGIATPLPS